MKYLSFLVAFCFFLMWIPECRGDCAPLVGTETNISCVDSKRTASGLYWRAEIDGTVKTLATCIAPGTCNSLSGDAVNFVAYLEGSRSYLTIKNASRNYPFNMETRWFCTYHQDNTNYSACNPMVVREKPQNPTCGPVSLNITSWELSLTCWTERVYPQAYCRLELTDSQNGSTTRYISPRTLDHIEINETFVYYYKTECSFEIPFEYISNYGVFYRVFMYPNRGSSSTAGVYSDWREIKVDVTDHGVDDDSEGKDNDEEDNKDEDKLFVPVIALAVALGVAVLVVIVLAVMVCRNRQGKELEQTRETAKQTKEPRQGKDGPVSTTPENRYDQFNMSAQNQAFVEEDENYEVLPHTTAGAAAEEEEEEEGEIYEN